MTVANPIRWCTILHAPRIAGAQIGPKGGQAARKKVTDDIADTSGLFSPGPLFDSAPAGEAERQAIDSLRGYAYQVAASTAAWLDLDDSTHLYLEVAEDYATVAAGVLNAVQVKDTRASARITLNSQSVRDAIANYVKLVALNPGHGVQLRYLTTSVIAAEGRIADRPAGEAGLLYWRKAASGSLAGARRAAARERLDVSRAPKERFTGRKAAFAHAR
jgi:hypothetical protein